MSAELQASTDEQAQRAAVIAEARTWLHTPWRHGAGIKGEACDCAHLLLRSYAAPGVVPRDFVAPPYPRSWFLHQTEERFLNWVVNYFHCTEVPAAEAQPGDLMLFRIGRLFAHGAILVAPQLLIHAFAKNGMVLYSETFDGELRKRSPRAFNPWGTR
jgi:NlpC/P60 family putative phage cell wall peptidase